jgi:hypothetical protein
MCCCWPAALSTSWAKTLLNKAKNKMDATDAFMISRYLVRAKRYNKCQLPRGRTRSIDDIG